MVMEDKDWEDLLGTDRKTDPKGNEETDDSSIKNKLFGDEERFRLDDSFFNG